MEQSENFKRLKKIKPFKIKPLKIINREEMKKYPRKVLENFQFKDVDQANKSIDEQIQYIKNGQDDLAECIDVQFTEIPKESEEN